MYKNPCCDESTIDDLLDDILTVCTTGCSHGPSRPCTTSSGTSRSPCSNIYFTEATYHHYHRPQGNTVRSFPGSEHMKETSHRLSGIDQYPSLHRSRRPKYLHEPIETSNVLSQRGRYGIHLLPLIPQAFTLGYAWGLHGVLDLTHLS